MTRIPLDPNGYSVNQSTGTIHTRYADHGNGTRTRTRKGVETLLDGKEGRACKTCYGNNPPYPSDTPRSPQRRRTPTASANGAGGPRKNAVNTWAAPGEMPPDEDAG